MKITGKGSFRGVPFLIIESAEQTGGNRLVQHEYPLRDIGSVQNMGRKAEESTIQVIVMGDDAFEQRDKLVEALRKSEAGELRHPNFATVMVQISEWRQTISTNAQRVVSFTITFVEDYDAPSPLAVINGSIELKKSISALVDSCIADFKSFCDSLNLASSYVTDTIDFATDIENSITNSIRSLTGATGLSSLLSSALAFNSSINNLQNAPDKVMQELSELLNAIKDVGGAKANNALSSIKNKNIMSSDANRYTKAFSVTLETVILANQSALMLEDSEKSIKQSSDDNERMISTLSDCEMMTEQLSLELQSAKIKASDLFFYDTAKKISVARQIFIKQAKLLSSKLPTASQVTPAVTEPALVMLYRHTGDCTQAARFIKRNGVKHPSFVVGGKQYEVIDETRR